MHQCRSVGRHESLSRNPVVSSTLIHRIVRQEGVGRKGHVSAELLRVKLYYELSIGDGSNI